MVPDNSVTPSGKFDYQRVGIRYNVYEEQRIPDPYQVFRKGYRYHIKATCISREDAEQIVEALNEYHAKERV